MSDLDRRVAEIAAQTDNVFTRAVVFACGGTDEVIEARLRSRWWQQLHPGVYLLGAAPPTWAQQVRAAVAAAGEGAEASHRCGLVLWGADGLRAAPVELVVPYGDRPVPRGVIVHRSRRIEPASVIDGVPVTSIERTLLESGAVTPPVVTEKAFAWAWRRNLTSPEKCERYLEQHGGKGRRGTRRLREVAALYAAGGRPPGSDGEVAFLRCLRAAGIEDPVRQLTIDLPSGAKATVDFACPARRKLIEFVGLEAHADSRVHAADALREDDLGAAGWQLRRFAPDTLRRNPEEVARRVLRFLLL
jgi:very-short-patch-repair endonuclease